ncbi:MAG: zinc ribbon domain-containing protein [Clostridiales bacterium]|nr:zinc ribbon domain-containing protein [Clostridiales bacterium]
MKCRSCGGEVSLQDKTCPYCGRVLTETAGHQAEPEQYKKKSEKSKRGLGAALSENIPIVISSVVMLLLIIGLIVANYISENAYHFREDAMQKESVKKYDEYSVLIKNYLDAGDYTGFASFMSYHNIAEYEEPYADLKLLWDITEEYVDLVCDVEEALIHGPEARIYSPENYVFNCRMSINDFYSKFKWDQDKIDADPYKDYMYDMKKKANIILETYLGLDDAAREAYLSDSQNKQSAYLEEVILHD